MGQFQSAEVCTTPACIQAASHILENLAPNWKDMDPCTDFDKMVCHGFNQLHDSDKEVNGVFLQNAHKNRLLREILSKPYDQATKVQPYVLSRRDNVDEHNFDMVHRTYAACMDSDAIKKAGVKPLLDTLVKFNEYWPIEMDFADDLFDEEDDKAGLEAVATALAKLNIRTWNGSPDNKESFLGNCFPDPTDPKTQRFTLYWPDLSFKGLANEYADPKETAKLEKKISGAFRAVFPVDLDDKTAARLAKDIVAFEIAILASGSPTAAANSSAVAGLHSRADPTQDPQVALKQTVLSMSQLASLAPMLGLDAFVQALVPEGHTPETVVVRAPHMWPGIEKVIKQQRKVVVQSWLLWKIIMELGSKVESHELKDLELGGEAGSNEYTTCVDHVDSALRWLLGHYFVKAAYSDSTRSTATKLAVNIREEMKVHVDKLSWMGEETRKRTIKKLDNMKINIGYPEHSPDSRSPDDLAAYYSGLNITDSFFDNAIEGMRYQVVTDSRFLSEPTSQSRWFPSYTHLTNAAYSSFTNSFFIPAGISLAPLFHVDLPEWALYGALGSIIGHEITHSLDSNGRKRDENALETNWWDEKSLAEYAERERCFVDQYSKYELVGPDGKKYPGNGNVTVGENISDAGGLAVAYDAWVKERKSMPDVWDQGLPGLGDFTHEQLFFIMFGNAWCDSRSPQERVDRLLKGGVHAPDVHRLMGGAANSRAFREAFKCPVKEPECELF